MKEPILDPTYWSERLRKAREGDLHHAIFRCSLEEWHRIESKHRGILDKHINPMDPILDCGCGWGRLLTLLPNNWRGRYLGVDISPDFIKLAYELYPRRTFICTSLLDQTLSSYQYFDWAILVSIRPMVRRNLGDEVWDQMEANIRKVTNKLLYLEYDSKDEGSVE